MSANLLPFVQFDYAGRLGPGDGRYLVRDAGSGDEGRQRVLVVGGLRGPVGGLVRGRRRRRGKPKRAGAGAAPPEVPITRLTVIRSQPFADRSEADAWLRDTGADEESADNLVTEALALVNRALHAHGVATQDPYGNGVSPGAALVIRVGFGTGDEVADGRWVEAVEVPTPAGPRRRSEALRPQEWLAAALGGSESQNACETLLLRARADLDAERAREAALQLRVGLEALLAEVSANDLIDEHAEKQAADLALLEVRRSITGDTANEALKGGLTEARQAEVAETLELCERVLRRRRILAG